MRKLLPVLQGLETAKLAEELEDRLSLRSVGSLNVMLVIQSKPRAMVGLTKCRRSSSWTVMKMTPFSVSANK